MDIRDEIIEPDTFIMYNRGINSCSIFQNEQNQLFFVKISHYLNEICEVYTYCLMQNHFRQNQIKKVY
jgi:hypothetical protein